MAEFVLWKLFPHVSIINSTNIAFPNRLWTPSQASGRRSEVEASERDPDRQGMATPDDPRAQAYLIVPSTNRTNLWIGHSSWVTGCVCLPLLTSWRTPTRSWAFLTQPSSDKGASITWPNLHWPLMRFLYLMMTMSPMAMLSLGLFAFA